MGSARNGPEGRKEDRPNQRYSEWVDWEDVFFWMLMVVRNSFEVLFWWYWLYMKKERRDWTGYASRGQAYIVESYWHLIIADTTVIMLSTFHNAWSKLRQSEVVQTDPQTMADTAILAQESAILAQERVEVILLWDTWCIFLFPSCWNWNTVDVRNPAPPGMYKTLLKSGKKPAIHQPVRRKTFHHQWGVLGKFMSCGCSRQNQRSKGTVSDCPLVPTLLRGNF